MTALIVLAIVFGSIFTYVGMGFLTYLGVSYVVGRMRLQYQHFMGSSGERVSASILWPGFLILVGIPTGFVLGGKAVWNKLSLNGIGNRMKERGLAASNRR